MNIEVHKFGGASVADANGFRNVLSILKQLPQGKKVVIVSATGKTTNALEKVTHAYMAGNEDTYQYFEDVRLAHVKILQDLNITDEIAIADIMDTFVEIEWIIEEPVVDPFDYVYDQMVSVGELISTKILYHFAKQHGLSAAWADARGLVMTDNTYREAQVDWAATKDNIGREIPQAFQEADIVVSQGFIGSSSENFTTTLGREGSDYTGAIFSYCLDAVSMSIWKDVPGILTADPRKFENVTKIDRLDYREAIEMTYYGAKVIHPKTIKPLQNKNIPLYVRPFSDIAATGTLISDAALIAAYPPVIVVEEDQALLHIATKDFSFVAEQHLSEIFTLMSQLNIKVNMMRNTAISFSACVPNVGSKLDKLVEKLLEKYTVVRDTGLDLITIRHYDGNTRKSLTEGKVVLFEETIKNTIRLAVRDIPTVVRKT